MGGKEDNRVVFCCRFSADFTARVGIGQTGCPSASVLML